MRIALIDDSKSVLNVFSSMLKKSGAVGKFDELLTFLTPEEFFINYVLLEEYQRLKHIKQHRIEPLPYQTNNSYDVVICDYNLGRNEINGFSLLFHLQEHGFEGKAILLTGDNSEEMLHRVKHTTSINYVFKGERSQKDNPYLILKQLIDEARINKLSSCGGVGSQTGEIKIYQRWDLETSMSHPWESHKDRRSRPDMASMMSAAKREAEKIAGQLSLSEAAYLGERVNLDRLCSILGDMDAVADSNPNRPIMRSEEYRRIVDSTAIVSKADKDGIITYVNDEFCRVSGYEYSEIVGKHHSLIRHPDVPAEVFKDLWHTISVEKRMWEGTIKNQTKSGGAYYVDARISPLIGEDGQVLGYIAIRFDVTEKTLLKEKQNEIITHQRELNRMILDEQSNIVVVATKEEGIVSANRVFFETFPYASIEDFKTNHFCICDLFVEFDGESGSLSTKDWFEKVVEEGGSSSHKVKMVNQNGETRTYSAIVKTASKEKGQSHHYFVITLSDITQAEIETDAARKEALAAHQESYAKSTFLANMSHEIRTPLNGIMPIIELIEENPLSKEQQEYISIVKRSANSLLHIINDILDFSKIESGSFEIEEIDFDPIKELESIVDLFVGYFGTKVQNATRFLEIA